MNTAFSWFNVYFTSCLFVSALRGCEATDVSSTMKDIWKTLGGSPLLWQGSNVCNLTDFIGVTCDDFQKWPIQINLDGKNPRLNGTIPSSLSSLINLTRIDLSFNQLSGSIPDISRLTSLQYLSLRGNELSGSIPSSIGDLTALQSLDLSLNRLNGSIPSSILNLTALAILDLSFNELSGSIPSSIGNMTALQSLDLSLNRLNGSIPSSIGNLTALQSLDLSLNRLSGSIPSSIGNLTALQSLDLSLNRLSGSIPSSIGNLTALQSLDLSLNRLNGSILLSIGNLTALQSLYLNGNQLSGSIPLSIGNLTALQSLDLSLNRLNGSILLSIGNLTALQFLRLRDNQLSGSIPSSIGNLTALRSLYLNGNQLSGSIPSSIGNLTALRSLYLNGNQLSGSIPLSIGNLTALQFLYLNSNQLSGSILLSIGNLAALQFLYLNSNQLSGSIPSSILNLTALAILDLSFNELSGSIPSSIGNLTALLSLRLSGNQLSGSIPSSIGNMTALQSLDLSGNQLSGSIPSSIGNMTALGDINLSGNQLSGSIPLVSFTRSLTRFDIHSNQLAGTIPQELINLPNLYILDLSNNQLNGSVPSRNSILSPLSILRLASNQFTSMGYIGVFSECDLNNNPLPCSPLQNVSTLCISSTFCPLAQTMRGIWKSLRGPSGYWVGRDVCNSTDYWGVTCQGGVPTQIELPGSSANLIGSIPATIGNLVNLTVLNLRSNSLTGPLPSNIGDLVNLMILDISTNELNGSIPETICYLKNLSYLNLGTNQFEGTIPPCIAGMTRLNSLYLKDTNNLTGPLLLLGSLTNLSNARLGSNNLNGTLPDSICNMQNIVLLDLGPNELTGSIPACVNAMTLLSNLSLAGNQMNGSIPLSLVNLPSLRNLNLGFNQFTGSLPARDGSLFGLYSLDVRYNQLRLSGYIDVTSNCNMSGNPFYCSGLNVSLSCNNTVTCAPQSNPTTVTLMQNLWASLAGPSGFWVGINVCDPIDYVGITCTEGVPTQFAYNGESKLQASTSAVQSTTSTTSSTSSTSLSSSAETTSPMTVVDALFANNTVISSGQAQSILNSTLQSDVETTKVISAVVLALLRNTSSFNYSTPTVSIQLQTYNLTSSGGQKIQTSIVNSNISVALPLSIFASQKEPVSVALSSVTFNPFVSIKNETIYSKVVGVSVYSEGREVEIRGTNELINITMGVIDSIPQGYEAKCQYWNEPLSSWSRDGCSLVVDGGVTICQSSHLTNFSIGVDRVENRPTTTEGNTKTVVIVVVCCVIGVILLLAIVAFIVYRQVYRYEKEDRDVSLFVVLDTDGIAFTDKIAETSRGEVWKGTYKETTTVAVKKCSPDVDVLRECDLLKGLHHPNIVQYLGRNITESYIVMEWMSVGTLQNYLSMHSHLSVETMFTIGRGLSSALSYLSSMGLVHTAVTPKKILLSGQSPMTAKLQCLSCVVTESTVYKHKKNQFHTAPEIVDKKRYSASGHVYSLGVLLWMMATDSHHLYNNADVQQSVTFVCDKTVDERVAEMIAECTREEEKRPKLSELSERMKTGESVACKEKKEFENVYAE
ncbi:putative leucine-rich repeat receptor-like protein kinase [Planoprotostelium fungivorum]|uniref:Putative leucine-rich repeat receptor-like protein kinase n=1 Tax=Planoprotostelium fungivorum TaxID=1890364 RepID=A0A2P6NU59_9EUKA|nr:putative leucine-rich repeat receptor-like protein kinase [Planoprotostelium fungivorum]